MALELYPHQAQDSQAVERMLADRGRAAVILPTGTGKSYIAFHLIEQRPEAAFLWLAPSEYIFLWGNFRFSPAMLPWPEDHGAGNGSRTHLSTLGRSHSTDELYPHRGSIIADPFQNSKSFFVVWLKFLWQRSSRSAPWSG